MEKKKSFSAQLKLGLSSYLRVPLFVVKHRLMGYFIVPLLFSVALYFIFEALAGWAESMDADFAWEWKAAWDWFIGIIVSSSFFVFRLLFETFVALVVMTPLIALLSEKVEEILTGKEYPFDFKRLMEEIWRGVLIAISNMALYAGLLLLWALFTGWWPGYIYEIGAAVLGAYFFGYSFIDYVNERRRLSIKQSNSFVFEHKGMAIGIGLVYYFVLMIPFVGFIVAPLFATVAAVFAMDKVVELGANQHSQPKIKKGMA